MKTCSDCGLGFSSVRAFERHRVGKLQYTHSEGLAMSPPRDDGRRCRPKDDLGAAGFVQNARGEWAVAKEVERARERFPGPPRDAETERRAA